MMKKIEVSKINIENIQDKLICPTCSKQININGFSLKCERGHSFDMSHKGYINLSRKNKNKEAKIYDRKLFESRKKFINSGYYVELHNIISKIINDKKDSDTIVDMGSGDGTHDNLIYQKLNNKNTKTFGVDIAKDGIDISSDYVYDNFIPILADLNILPFGDNSIDVILNILSPSNEKKMQRVLREDGIIIKVTPKKEYLKELRKALELREYENEEVIEKNIKNNYIIKQKYEISNNYDLNDNDLHNLINMTPLAKNRNFSKRISNITIALNIYLLKPKSENNNECL